MKKFIEIIKKNVLIKRTSTVLLIVILVALFISLTLVLNSLEINPIDLTADKLYTLTDESKEKAKAIENEISINFIGMSEDSPIIDLAKQYHNENEKITIETATSTERPDLMKKYNLDENYFSGAIIEAKEGKSKIIASNEFYTYDTTTYDEIDITEEKLTNAIIYVSSDEIPSVYVLEGYSNYSLDKNLTYLKQYVENEIVDCKSLNIMVEGKIPEDCAELIITSPEKDFDDITTNAIIEYINNGGNILWFNLLKVDNQEFTNVNKILELYGVKPFEVGVIVEGDTTKMLSKLPTAIVPNMGYSEITKNTTLAVLLNSTKINFASDEELSELKVEKTNLLTTSDKAFFKTDLSNYELKPTENSETGSFVVGALLQKTIVTDSETNVQNENSTEIETTTESEAIAEKDQKVSKLIIYGENQFASDYEIIQGSGTPGIGLYYNVQLVVDSVTNLLNRKDNELVIRKDTNTVQVTLTAQQNIIVQTIIFVVPAVIILSGILVWIYRRRKK